MENHYTGQSQLTNNDHYTHDQGLDLCGDNSHDDHSEVIYICKTMTCSNFKTLFCKKCLEKVHYNHSYCNVSDFTDNLQNKLINYFQTLETILEQKTRNYSKYKEFQKKARITRLKNLADQEASEWQKTIEKHQKSQQQKSSQSLNNIQQSKDNVKQKYKEMKKKIQEQEKRIKQEDEFREIIFDIIENKFIAKYIQNSLVTQKQILFILQQFVQISSSHENHLKYQLYNDLMNCLSQRDDCTVKVGFFESNEILCSALDDLYSYDKKQNSFGKLFPKLQIFYAQMKQIFMPKNVNISFLFHTKQLEQQFTLLQNFLPHILFQVQGGIKITIKEQTWNTRQVDLSFFINDMQTLFKITGDIQVEQQNIDYDNEDEEYKDSQEQNHKKSQQNNNNNNNNNRDVQDDNEDESQVIEESKDYGYQFNNYQSQDDELQYANFNSFTLIIGERNKIGEQGCIKIGNLLSKMQTIDKLDIIIGWNNDIQPQGTNYLFESMSQMSQLLTLNVHLGRNNQIECEGAKLIGQNIIKMVQLENFNLHIGNNNSLLEEGLMAIRNSLPYLPHLQNINITVLHNNGINLQTAENISELVNELEYPIHDINIAFDGTGMILRNYKNLNNQQQQQNIYQSSQQQTYL